VEKNSLVVFSGNLTENVRKFMESNGFQPPEKDKTTGVVLEIIPMPTGSVFSTGLRLDIFPPSVIWTMAEWDEVQKPTTINVNDLMSAQPIPAEQEMEDIVIPEGVMY
jgi:hypothetical protein